MTNRHQRRANKAGALGKRETGAGIGTVMTLEGSDVPLAMDSLIDLEKIQQETEKIPHFITRQADPMRPFTRHETLDHVVKNEVSDIAFSAAHPISKVPVGLPISDKIAREIIERANAAYANGMETGIKAQEMFSDEFMRAMPNIIQRLTPEGKKRFFKACSEGRHGDALKAAREVLSVIEDESDEKNNAVLTIQAELEILEILKDPKLQRLGETAFHKLIEAFRARKVLFPISKHRGLGISEEIQSGWSTVAEAHIFVVQHDWASAFRNSEGFADGDFRLPYQGAIFEFRISGRRVCLSLETFEDGGGFKSSIMFVETSAGWAMAFARDSRDGKMESFGDDILLNLHDFCIEQVRAVCISLEAEVAVTEVIRAPHRLNRKRERAGKLPVFDHHIVSLARRKHYLPRAPEPGDIEDEPHRKRMHWVRAHYRHYTNTKAWIKWHLRGDWDLGFVDKEYRL